MHAFLSFRRIGAVVVAACAVSVAIAQDFPQPTEAHELLAREAGVWEASTKSWMAPGAPPEESTGVETNQMLGGFWLVSEFQGDMGGVPFTGRGQIGYDPETGDYVMTWIDSMAPKLFQCAGSYDETTRTLTFVGEGTDFMTGEAKRMKLATRYDGDDRKHFEIHEAPVGSDEWRKSMEIDYVRRD